MEPVMSVVTDWRDDFGKSSTLFPAVFNRPEQCCWALVNVQGLCSPGGGQKRRAHCTALVLGSDTAITPFRSDVVLANRAR